jgi:hypothetical protein
MRNVEIKSASATQFTDLLTQGEVETETLAGLRADGIGAVKGVSLLAVDPYAWQVEMYGGTESGLVGKVGFSVADGVAVSIDSTTYYSYTSAVEWPVPSNRSNPTVVFGIRNMSGDTKTGAIVLTLNVDKYNG